MDDWLHILHGVGDIHNSFVCAVILAVSTLADDFGFVRFLYFDFGVKQILKLENFFGFFNRF
jgi:hypothetical protein